MQKVSAIVALLLFFIQLVFTQNVELSFDTNGLPFVKSSNNMVSSNIKHVCYENGQVNYTFNYRICSSAEEHCYYVWAASGGGSSRSSCAAPHRRCRGDAHRRQGLVLPCRDWYDKWQALLCAHRGNHYTWVSVAGSSASGTGTDKEYGSHRVVCRARNSYLDWTICFFSHRLA